MFRTAEVCLQCREVSSPVGNQGFPVVRRPKRTILRLAARPHFWFSAARSRLANYRGLALGVGQKPGALALLAGCRHHANRQAGERASLQRRFLRLRYGKRLNDFGTRFNFYSLLFYSGVRHNLQRYGLQRTMKGGVANRWSRLTVASLHRYENLYNLASCWCKAKTGCCRRSRRGGLACLSLSAGSCETHRALPLDKDAKA